MSEWWSYRPGDLLMISLRVYERLFVLHNQALWPGQWLALALGAGLLLALWRPGPARWRLAMAGLAAAWVFVAWAFLWQRYAPLNWGIRYLVPFFGLQALLLLATVLGRGARFSTSARGASRGLGLGLVTYAVFGHPLTAWLHGRGLAGAEVIGLTPDPLAIATLGVAVLVRPARRGWALLAIPALWCLTSAVTLQLLGASGAWLPLAAVAIAVAARLLPAGRP
ncbi:MFS transporter permease [Halomonas nitroreducens]|uniref:MFS transporter permease n=1 Tax=Halomonas nitroreducens TaxID=447425 RepID=A0A3S0JUW5_9GAMM|nr:MFS transporter permease [Halomonas nitroreducens]RTR01073.1 MFS transporter permease [Halomonas nitroreducens]